MIYSHEGDSFTPKKGCLLYVLLSKKASYSVNYCIFVQEKDEELRRVQKELNRMQQEFDDLGRGSFSGDTEVVIFKPFNLWCTVRASKDPMIQPGLKHL